MSELNLGAKQAGKRSAGKPHAAFDEAGTGNGSMIGYRACPRPYDERDVETEHGQDNEAPADERAGNG